MKIGLNYNPEPDYTKGHLLSEAEAMVRLEPELPWYVWQTILKLRNVREQSPVWFAAEFGGVMNNLNKLYSQLETIYGE